MSYRTTPQVGDKWLIEPCEDYPVGLTLKVESLNGDLIFWNDGTHTKLKHLIAARWMRPISEPPIVLTEAEAEGIETYFHRYTSRSKTVLNYAKEAAELTANDGIEPQHILYGLAKEGSGVAANVLNNCGITAKEILEEVKLMPAYGVKLEGLPATHLTRCLFNHAVEAMKSMNHQYVGTEHLLLGAIANKEYGSYKILVKLGLNLDTIKENVMDLLGFSKNKFEAKQTSDNIISVFADNALAALYMQDTGKVMFSSSFTLDEIPNIIKAINSIG